MALQVLETGFLVTIQDAGRFGYERYGVPVSGAMDWFALAAANQLVGNPPGAAGIESAYQGVTVYALEDCLVAAAGRGVYLSVEGREFPGWMSVLARAGSLVTLANNGAGTWGYLACSGGVDVAPVLGSRSTYLRGGFGGLEGRALQPGDVLPAGRHPPGSLSNLAGRRLAEERLPGYAVSPVIDAILGPQSASFSAEDTGAFLSQTYTVGEDADRMGYRLRGEPLASGGGADILSEGLALGAVQVPGDGLPIVMLSDRQTTGGYRKIATLTRACLPVLAQCQPGSRVRFRETSVEQAQKAYRWLVQGIRDGLDEDGDEYGYA